MQRLTTLVQSNIPIAEAYYRMEFRLPPGFQPPLPGQFLTLRIGDGISPLLRRPFAYAAYNSATSCASLIYERRGNATHLLAAYREGDELDVLGPLGNSFPAPVSERTPILVAGGIGIGPLLFLHAHLKSRGFKPRLVTGARNAAKIPLSELPQDALICTDDGSAGLKGNVVDALKLITDIAPQNMEFYLCGPHGMMKAVTNWNSQISSSLPIPSWVSMEQTMACAVGACMGCVVKVHHEKQYARVCSEGPIFPADQLDWS